MVDTEVFDGEGRGRALIFGRSLDELNAQPARPQNMAISISSDDEVLEVRLGRQPFSHVLVPALDKGVGREQYVTYPEDATVERVLREIEDGGDEVRYEARFANGMRLVISFENLLRFENGEEAISAHEEGHGEQNDYQDSDRVEVIELSDDEEEEEEEEEEEDEDVAPRRSRRQTTTRVPVEIDEDSGDELVQAPARLPTRRTVQQTRLRPRSGKSGSRSLRSSTTTNYNGSSEERTSESGSRRRSLRRPTRNASDAGGLRRSEHSGGDLGLVYLIDEDYDEDQSSSDEHMDLMDSDVLPRSRKRKRASNIRGALTREVNGVKYRKSNAGTRQSDRATRHQKHMGEVEVGDIYRSDSDAPRPAPKAIGAREAFQTLPSTDRFRLRHCQQCDTCGKWGGGPYGQLVHCQGCSLSYHKSCLGTRSTRDHLVTKIGEANFVLQCRRCVSFAKSKDQTSPDQGMCQQCREPGPACLPFRKRKTPGQEEKEREENEGEDPVVHVGSELINNVNNVLFRCTSCWRAFHYHHLRARNDTAMVEDNDEEAIAEQRVKEYSRDWQCTDCVNMPAKLSGLVAWRPIDPELYVPGADVQEVDEDMKEYLVKWEAMSHYQCRWMPGAWVWGIGSHSMRKAFAKRIRGPTMNTEDAIPEDYLRIDIVLDVKFTSIVDTRAEEVDKARIREVGSALMKFKGLGYEDAVWEKVPTPEDGDRWSDFVKAYDDWVMGRYIKSPKLASLKIRLDKVHATDFKTLEKKKQPDKLVGGELMKYQIEGLNWLYYRWWSKQNAILADEMGLGKTIQIIGFLATLIQDHHCFPFLVVVPNGTVANWRREIKQWAPSLRLVTYFGSSQARSMQYQYELYPEGAKELRCHIVVTSYDAAADENCRKFFRSPTWQGLIVDEGQRLKSDKTILYEALSNLKIPFKILLTGTPLQNNARELFNLLQFLDEKFDAAALELEYEELNKENVPKLHELIRPFFLRRTKAQVLTFLPPMAQIVLPVSMSSLQAKLYKSILSRNPELIRALYDTSRPIGKGDRASLNNILMQLRKCLCHPFVYSNEIEEISHEAAVSHRNLVEASAKLQLLEILLPKLQERGHRVLIFSQFLNMLDIIEDFLDGLALRYQRLDGTINSMEKQKRIDAFNAPDSPLFAFLLSTRAGGVGINLATADTVIIMDPDFNPHQDLQALSRAHRIGQKHKVLCFQLMTRATVEEKIVQVGRKKMALDHVLIEQMDRDEEEGVDVESILRFGAADILEGKTQEIRYDEASTEKLIDRTTIENTKSGDDGTAESQFSFARVWANDMEAFTDNLESDVEKAPDQSVWDNILKERERQAAEEAAARQELLGRGRRSRQTVDYSAADKDKDPVLSPLYKRRKATDSDSDTDFQAEDKKSDAGDDSNDENDDQIDAHELATMQQPQKPQFLPRGLVSQTFPERAAMPASPKVPVPPEPPKAVPSPQLVESRTGVFRRASIRWADANELDGPAVEDEDRLLHPVVQCVVCQTRHRRGYCPLKLAGPEFCNLCGLAHYGQARTCPHIRSETQVRDMLAALKLSPESSVLIDLARKYLTGVKGTLVQDKKRKAEKAGFQAAHSKSQQGSFSTTASAGVDAVQGGVPSVYFARPPIEQGNGARAPFQSLQFHGPPVFAQQPAQANPGAQMQRHNGANSLPQPQGQPRPENGTSQDSQQPPKQVTAQLRMRWIPGGGQYSVSRGMDG